MIDGFLLIGLPYLAIVTAVVAGYWRWRAHRFTFSARSSQFLEARRLLWGSAPWHVGIFVVLLGHLLALFFPAAWAAAMSVPALLVTTEVVGAGAAVLSLIGLGLLVARRITSARVQAVTTTMDLVVVGLLFGQVALGLASAIQLRNGALWATGTAVPYIWSLLTLRPEMAWVADFPVLFKLHLAGAWLLVLLLPFTRLIHLLSLPLGYLWRAPQLVIWSSRRRRDHAVAATVAADSRRAFLKGAIGVTGAGGLMALGVSEKTMNFFKGPGADPEADTELLQKKLTRLQQTAEERALELERKSSSRILVARHADLSEQKGKYFIDYAMAPGLAFRGPDGLPIVRSAKCTHLGCTVGSELDAQGQILCPCHVSYFDVRTGAPAAGAPARLPLPEIGWALLDGTGAVVAAKEPGQPIQGVPTAEVLAGCTLYITRPAEA